MNEEFITIVNDSEPKKSNFIWTVLCLIGVIVALIVAVVVWWMNKPKLPEVVDVTNYSSIEDVLPSEAQGALRAQLYYLLSQHFDVPDEVKKVKAEIRQDTYKEKNNGDVISASFILDIDEYQQTYKVSISWSETIKELPIDVLLDCARRDEAKYPDAMCYGMYNNSDSVNLYLPYEGTTSLGDKYSLEFGYYDEDGTEKVLVKVNDCGNKDRTNVAVEDAKKYIKSINLDITKLKFVPVSNYSGCSI